MGGAMCTSCCSNEDPYKFRDATITKKKDNKKLILDYNSN